MKNFILGLVAASLIYGLAAKAIDVKLEEITVRDLYAAQIMNGYLSRGSMIQSDSLVNDAFIVADKMVQRRKTR